MSSVLDNLAEKSEWQIMRERQKESPQHQAMAEEDSRRGTHRDMYRLMDRIFVMSHNHTIKGVIGFGGAKKPDFVTIQTKEGPRNVSRISQFHVLEEINENKRYAKRKRRRNMAKATKKAQRRQARR